MLKALILLSLIFCAAFDASAQTEVDLKRHFEGRHVTLKLDMPATKDGVNVYPERAQPLNYGEYAARLKQHGTSIRRGESVMVTKVKVKGRHVEFHLGGGGYGTFGDETDASVFVPSAGKSRREKNLEDAVKRETDPERRKRLKEELNDLRRRREREDRLNQAIAAEAEESRRARIEQKALQGGSRFNVHFGLIDSSALTPESLVDALKRYVDFSELEEGGDDSGISSVSYLREGEVARKPGVVSVGPRSTYLKEGLSAQEVGRLLGSPSKVYERERGGAVVTTYVFPRGEGRVLVAEFAGGILVRSTVENTSHSVQAAGLGF